MQVGEGPLLNESHCGGVIGFGFARKPCDNVGADGGVGQAFVDEFDAAGVVLGAVPAVHGREYAIRGGLQRHVEMRREAIAEGHEIDERERDVERFNGTDAEAFYHRIIENSPNKFEEFDSWREIAAVGAKIDAAQNNFAVAGRGKALDLCDDFLRRKAAGFSANKRDHAKGATSVAAVLDLQRGAGVIPFPPEHGSNENIGEVEDVAGENFRAGRKTFRVLQYCQMGCSMLRPYNRARGLLVKRGDAPEKIGDLRLMRIAHDETDSRENRKLLWSALSVTASDNNLCGGTGSVKFADGVARLGIGSSGDRAGVQNNDVGLVTAGSEMASLFAQLALDGGSIGMRRATAKLFDVKRRHVSGTCESY